MPVKIVQSSTFTAHDRERKRTEIHVGSRIAPGKMSLRGVVVRETLGVRRGKATFGVAERVLDSRVPALGKVPHGASLNGGVRQPSARSGFGWDQFSARSWMVLRGEA